MTSFKPDTILAARVAPSPNHDVRAHGIAADMVLLHYTGMKNARDAERRLCDTAAKVSSHYLVDEDGAICQMVPETRRAWHAGVSSWHDATDINSHSIGIEIANPGHDFGYPDFPNAQIDAVIALCGDIIRRCNIAPQRVLAHSDVAPARKNDPGEKFPWERLSEAGIGLWIDPTKIVPGPELDPGDKSGIVSTLQASLKRFGYSIAPTGNYDETTRQVVTAFQRHYRPARVDGFADHSTLETLKRLLALAQA